MKPNLHKGKNLYSGSRVLWFVFLLWVIFSAFQYFCDLNFVLSGSHGHGVLGFVMAVNLTDGDITFEKWFHFVI